MPVPLHYARDVRIIGWSMTKNTSPQTALDQNQRKAVTLSACEHYAGTERFIRKGLELQSSLGVAFDLTCDAEDGAEPGRELEQVEMISSLLSSPENKMQRCGVRIQGCQNPFWKKQLQFIVDRTAQSLSYITIPKVRGLKDVQHVIMSLNECLKQKGISRTIPLHVLIETQGALREVWKIAALAEVEVLDFGLWDFVADHRGVIPEECLRSPGQFEHQLLIRAKTEIVAAAHFYGLVPAHNVTAALDNPHLVGEDALRARREFGFLRMWSIHPSQIVPIIQAMAPDFQQLEKATKILLEAQANNWAPIRFDGELHDLATYRYYWELLKQGKASGVRLPEGVETFFSASEL